MVLSLSLSLSLFCFSSFSSLLLLLLLLCPLSSILFSLGSSPSSLFSFFFFFLLFLPCFYRRKTGGGTSWWWPVCCRPSNTWKVVGKWCPCFGVFLSKRRKEIRRKGEEKIFFFPCLACPGEEEDLQCRQNGTVLGFFFFFFFFLQQ